MLFQKESRSAIFGAKVVSSLNQADLSFMNSVTGSVCRAKCLNIFTGYLKLLVMQFTSHLPSIRRDYEVMTNN